MKNSFERQKRFMSTSYVKNMGTIFWQFNTNWQAPGWATIDYSGNWKVSHNMIKQSYEPLQVNAFFASNSSILSIHAISELNQTYSAEIHLETYTFNQTDSVPNYEAVFAFILEPRSGQLVSNVSSDSIF